VGKPDRKTPIGRPRHRWVDDIKMDLRKLQLGDMDVTWLRIGTSGGLF
jgi:hypothetical protein